MAPSQYGGLLESNSVSAISSRYGREKGQNWAADCKALQSCKQNYGSLEFWPRGQRSRNARSQRTQSTRTQSQQSLRRAASTGCLQGTTCPPSRPRSARTDFNTYVASCGASSVTGDVKVTIGNGGYGLALNSQKELRIWPHPCSYSAAANDDGGGPCDADGQALRRSISAGSIRSSRPPSASSASQRSHASSASCTVLAGDGSDGTRRIPLVCPSLRTRGKCGLPHCPYIHEVGKARRVNDYVGAKNMPWEMMRPSDKVGCKDVPCRFMKLLGKCVHGDDCVYSHDVQCEATAGESSQREESKDASAPESSATAGLSSGGVADGVTLHIGRLSDRPIGKAELDAIKRQSALQGSSGAGSRPGSASRGSRPGSAFRGRPTSAGSSSRSPSARGTYAAPIRHSDIIGQGLEARTTPVHRGWGDIARYSGGLL